MSLQFAQALVDAGIPVVICHPNRDWQSGSDQPDVYPPAGWSTVTAEDCDLSAYRPGVDTLAMVGGHGIDVVDVDPKAGGSIDNLPPFEYFGETLTPSGGIHRYVRSTGIGKLSPLKTSAGMVGDYVGGTRHGGGRLLAYLPGSARPKYPNATYIVTRDLDLDVALESDPDENLVAALLGAGGTTTGEPGEQAAADEEVQTFLAEHSTLPDSPCPYGREAVTGILAKVDTVIPGDPVQGRHGWAVRAATRVVELVRAGCATSADLGLLEDTLHRIKPEGGSQWNQILAWALSNAKGDSACTIHNQQTQQWMDLVMNPAAPAKEMQNPHTPATDTAAATAPPATSDVSGRHPIDQPPGTSDDAIEAALNAQAEFANRVTAEAYTLKVREAARRQVAAERAGAPQPPQIVGLDDFLAIPDPEIAYRINYMWPIGGRVILAAQYKAGKTTMVGNIVRSLADSTPFLERYDVNQARVTVIDDELDERTLRRWLRDQDITQTQNVRLVTLRGRTASFDILDPETRSQWAQLIADTDVLILDCLRPVLDALGLSEDKDAGRFLVALDALLHDAGVTEAMVVHHMGHNGERSRDDSRILDWPDATWKLVREDTEDPGSPRYFSAFGRDVNIHECRLGYNQQTRGLTIDGGNRKDAITDEVIAPLIQLLEANPDGISKNQIEIKLVAEGYGRQAVRDGIKRLLNDHRAVQGYGPNNAKPIRLIPQIGDSE